MRGSQVIGLSLITRQRGQWHSTCVKPSAANSSMVVFNGFIHPKHSRPRPSALPPESELIIQLAGITDPADGASGRAPPAQSYPEAALRSSRSPNPQCSRQTHRAIPDQQLLPNNPLPNEPGSGRCQIIHGKRSYRGDPRSNGYSDSYPNQDYLWQPQRWQSSTAKRRGQGAGSCRAYLCFQSRQPPRPHLRRWRSLKAGHQRQAAGS
jgi:hypothetical protein